MIDTMIEFINLIKNTETINLVFILIGSAVLFIVVSLFYGE